MGKLHKIRRLYQQTDKETKIAMAGYLTNGVQKNRQALEKAMELMSFGSKIEYSKPYYYYLKSLLIKDKFLGIKEKKWTKRISQLVQHKGNTTRFNAYF